MHLLADLLPPVGLLALRIPIVRECLPGVRGYVALLEIFASMPRTFERSPHSAHVQSFSGPSSEPPNMVPDVFLVLDPFLNLDPFPCLGRDLHLGQLALSRQGLVGLRLCLDLDAELPHQLWLVD